MATKALTAKTWTAVPVSGTGTATFTNPSAGVMYVKVVVGGVNVSFGKCKASSSIQIPMPAGASVFACPALACTLTMTVA